jgi:hypothetical protein
MAAASIILLSPAPGPFQKSNFEFLCPVAFRGLEQSASCDKACPLHLLNGESSPSAAWEALPLNLPIRYRARPGHLILHSSLGPAGYLGVFWDNAWKRKESNVRCTGGTPRLIIYGAKKPSYLCLCRQAVSSILFSFPSVHLLKPPR